MARQGYLGNPLIKPVNIPVYYTKAQVEEFQRCVGNPIYFIKKYVKIVHPDKGIIPFELYDYQEEFIKSMHQNRFVICKFPRQSGKSSAVVAYFLHWVLFHQNVSLALLANRKDKALELLGRLQFAYEKLPKWMQQGVKEWNKGNIVLENGSRIVASSTTSSAVRGESLNCVTGDQYITVKSKITGKIEKILINELEKRLKGAIDILYNTEYEVLTKEGFKDFIGLSITKSEKIVKITSEIGTIKTTPDHKLFNGLEWVIAQDYKIGDNIEGVNGITVISDITQYTSDENVYDLLEVNGVRSFFCNNYLVHNCVFLDEFAHVAPHIQDEFFKSVFPTISSGETTKCFIVSTPNGMEMFYKLWTDAKNRKNGYKPLEIGWWQTPGRDEKWKSEQIEILGENGWNQEFGGEFLGSSNTLISGAKLATMAFIDPIFVNGSLKIYEIPQEEHNYFITVDVSQGKGIDYSAFSVFDATKMPYKQVAVYKDNSISPLLYPTLIKEIALRYNNAHVLVEINDVGIQVSHILHYDLEYPNLIFVQHSGTGKGQIISSGFSKNIQMGLKTTKFVKKMGCNILKDLIESNKLLIYDFDTISELSTFVFRKNTYQADEGKHDDICMSLVFFAWACVQDYFKEMMDQDIRKTMYNKKIQELEENLVPFGYIDNGLNQQESPIYIENDGTRWFSI